MDPLANSTCVFPQECSFSLGGPFITPHFESSFNGKLESCSKLGCSSLMNDWPLPVSTWVSSKLQPLKAVLRCVGSHSNVLGGPVSGMWNRCPSHPLGAKSTASLQQQSAQGSACSRCSMCAHGSGLGSRRCVMRALTENLQSPVAWCQPWAQYQSLTCIWMPQWCLCP